MTDSRLYTIRDVARELGLPESTVRYYRNAFAAFLPSVGTGRRRRYPAEAIPLLRLVAEGYAQNRPRIEIEQALGETGASQAASRPAVPVLARGFGGDGRDEMLATILDGERDRREVMWQVARELVRLGEAIERQQALLTKLAETATSPSRSLAPAAVADAVGAAEGGEAETGTVALGVAPVASAVPAESVPSAVSAAQLELDRLRQELARERELVERLRRSKLDIERRAAEAEARLGQGSLATGRRGFLGKLLAREDDAHH
jgi:DNA-binding transcriptional MerR regulator